MDPFTAYLLIKQIKEDNKTLNQSQTKIVQKEQQNKNCVRCGQNPYWCQCLTKGKY